jgi:hypothetical protein
MEGMWSVEFTAPGHQNWYGVAVFVGDQLFGGDPLFYWHGKYTEQGGRLEGILESFSHTGAPAGNILGQVVAKYSMKLSAMAPASRTAGTSLTANGPAGLIAKLTRRA